MGNCLFGGLGEVPDDHEVIKVVTSNGGIMELLPPITARCVTREFPAHGIFRSHDLFWKPLPHQEELLAGESYYLLPLNDSPAGCGHVRSNSIPNTGTSAPYRMSFDNQGMLLRRSNTSELFSRYANTKSKSNSKSSGNVDNNNGGVWKVKLVISPDQLLDILSQDTRTQELIESVRTVAKCGNGASSATSAGYSDDWSLCSNEVISTNMFLPRKMQSRL